MRIKGGSPTALPGPHCRPFRPLYYPSFPRKRESRTVLRQTIRLMTRYFWIPACAGMTVVKCGNDGGYMPYYRGNRKDGSAAGKDGGYVL